MKILYTVLLICTVASLPCAAKRLDCAHEHFEYGAMVNALYRRSGTTAPALDATAASAQGRLLHHFLDSQIASRLHGSSKPDTAARVRAWLRCIQTHQPVPELPAIPLVANLTPDGSAIFIAEEIPLDWPRSLSYLQVWSRRDDQWVPSTWIDPRLQNTWFNAWIMRSPIAGEYWFLEGGVPVSGDGISRLILGLVSWRSGHFREIWRSPGSSIFNSSVRETTPTSVVIRSEYDIYKNANRTLLRQLVVTKSGLEQKRAWYTYEPHPPSGAPMHPCRPIPLTQPNQRGKRSEACQ